MSFWNVSSASGSLVVVRGRHDHFEWLAFDTDQNFLIFDFKINFLFAFVSSDSRLVIISRVRHVLYGDSLFIQKKVY